MKMLEFVSAENPDVFVVSVHPGVFLTDMVKDSSFKIDPAIVDDSKSPPARSSTRQRTVVWAKAHW